MSGFQNNGPKIPEIGSGILRPPKDPKEKSPQFRGLVNCNGQIMSMSIWYMAPNGQMPASFSVKASPYVPNAQTNGAPAAYGQPQQQPMQYGQPPPQQYAPPQGYPPQHQPWPQQPQQPPQQAQRAYQPAPQATQPPPYQPPQAPAYGAPQAQQRPAAQPYGAPGGTFDSGEIPFSAEFR